MASSSSCELAGSVGTVVQLSLAVLVGFVLIFEYFAEYLKSLCSNHPARSFRSFWFDSYKICAGALVSHIFNLLVAISINELSNDADQCALYAVAFFYEACGVPFVQLLQYCIIQYSLKMSSFNWNNQQRSDSLPSDPVHSVRSRINNQIILDEACRQRWQYISKPGLYDENRYPVNDCLHCRSCQDTPKKCEYFKLGMVILIALTMSFLTGYFGFMFYFHDWYIDVSIGFLVCIFLLSTAIAPVSSLWQTMQWVTLKLFEKSIWSLFAMAQAKVFGRWSLLMSTGDTRLDAWLYVAIVPIILNAFMFFMFSRISRLKLPCFAPKYAAKIEKERENMQLNEVQLNSDMQMDDQNKKFDKREAFKVGVGFMLIINTALLMIAATFLCMQGALESIWILFLSMIVAPTLCSIATIYIFAYIIDRNIHLCNFCVNKKNVGNYTNFDRIQGSINKLSIHLRTSRSQ